MLLKRMSFVLVVLALALSVTSAAAAKSAAPILGVDSQTAIPGRYIIVFQPGTPAGEVSAAAEHARGLGAQVDYIYDVALLGFAGSFTDQAIEGLSHNPNVKFIEADRSE